MTPRIVLAPHGRTLIVDFPKVRDGWELRMTCTEALDMAEQLRCMAAPILPFVSDDDAPAFVDGEASQNLIVQFSLDSGLTVKALCTREDHKDKDGPGKVYLSPPLAMALSDFVMERIAEATEPETSAPGANL